MPQAEPQDFTIGGGFRPYLQRFNFLNAISNVSLR